MKADAVMMAGENLAMNGKLKPGWLYVTAVVLLSLWILQSFLLSILVACVTAAASWPVYRKFADRVGGDVNQSVTALVFTALITTFVLAPLTFALGALATESHRLLLAIAAADKQGIATPEWVGAVPGVGPWVAAQWDSQFAHPGALALWVQRASPAALLGWAQLLGRFMARHVFIITFTILILFFLYRNGESMNQQLRHLVRHDFGERAEAMLQVATRALRASVNSMLLVAIFDGVASGAVYAIVGVPHSALWAAITGSLALVPFLGYVAVALLSVQLAVANAATSAFLVFVLGAVILFCGDKILRPALVRDGTRLSFVWVLMSCLGGFEVLGLVGLVIGPVALTLAAELWAQRLRDVQVREVSAPAYASDRFDDPHGQGTTVSKTTYIYRSDHHDENRAL